MNTKHEVTSGDIVAIADEDIGLGATIAVRHGRARAIRPPCTESDCLFCFHHGVPVVQSAAPYTGNGQRSNVDAAADCSLDRKAENNARCTSDDQVGAQATVVERRIASLEKQRNDLRGRHARTKKRADATLALLAEVFECWTDDAFSGDGIQEEHHEVYARARDVVGGTGHDLGARVLRPNSDQNRDGDE